MADNDEEALKKKFEQLQLQQQQKLQKRKEKKQKQQDDARTEALEAEKTTASAFGVDDELDLKVGQRQITQAGKGQLVHY